MSVFDDIKGVIKDELNANDLGTIRSAYDNFVKGTPQERAAAESIATDVNKSVTAFMHGQIDKHTLDFVLTKSKENALLLAEVQAIRLRKSAIKAFFNIVINLLAKKISLIPA